LFLATILSVLLYYVPLFLARFIEKKFKIHVGSFGFLSLSDLSYSGSTTGSPRQQHSYKLSVNKIHLQIRRPHNGYRTWVTLTIDDVSVVLSSIRLFTQSQSRKLEHKRQPSLIMAVPQKAWWSSVWLVKYIMAKISAIPFQFVVSWIASCVDVNITNVDVLVEDLGQFKVNEITLGMILFANVDLNQTNQSHTNSQHSIRNRLHLFTNKLLRITLSYSSLSIRDISSAKLYLNNQKNVTSAIEFPNMSTIILSCYLSAACTSLLAFDINVSFEDINVCIDSILSLIKSIQAAIPKKVTRGPSESQRFSQPQLGQRKKTFKMASLLIVRRMRMARRKKTPIEFLKTSKVDVRNINITYSFSNLENISSVPISTKFTIMELSASLEQIMEQSNESTINPPRKSMPSLFSDDMPNPLELKMNILLNGLYCDVTDTSGMFRMMQICTISSEITCSKPLVRTVEYDPNLFFFTGKLNIVSPEIAFDYGHFGVIESVVNSINVEDFKEERTSVQIKPTEKQEKQKKLQNIPKLIATISIVNPLIKITEIPSSNIKSDNSQLIFGFQNILFDVNGDYTDLNDLPTAKHNSTVSRRYSKGWKPPTFSVVYNLIANLKTQRMRLYTFENDLILNHSWEIYFITSALGTITSYIDKEETTTYTPLLELETIQIDIGSLIDGMEIQICQKKTFELLQRLINTMINIIPIKDASSNHPVPSPSSNSYQSIITYFEVLLFRVSLSSLGIRIAEVDSPVDSTTSRGFDIRLQGITFDHRGSRTSIDPTGGYNERIGLGLSTDEDTEFRCETGGRARGFIRGFNITPIMALWDKELLKNTVPLLSIPEIEIQNNLSVERTHNYSSKLDVKVSEIRVKYLLSYHYCCLVGVMNIIKLLPLSIKKKKHTGTIPSTSMTENVSSFQIEANILLNHVDVFVDLPDDIKLFIRLDDSKYRFASIDDHGFHIKCLRAFGTSPSEEGLWDELANIKNAQILLLNDDDTKRNSAKLPLDKNQNKILIRVQTEAIHVRVPYHYILANVIESAVNLTKVIKHLQERVFVPENICIIDPEEEGPKYLPTIQVKVGIVTFQLEDDPFEAKLSAIWKLGCLEQQSRLGRETAFEAKAKVIRSHEYHQNTNGEGGLASNDANVSSLQNGGPLRSQPTPRANLSIDKARVALNEYNSRNWIKCVKTSILQQKFEYTCDNLPIPLATRSRHPALFRITVEKISLVLSAPLFPMSELPHYMHKMGKGLPLDTKFAFLVPMHLNCKLNEAWAEIRDYPLPLAHIPSANSINGEEKYSCDIEGHFVVGEELKGVESTRRIGVQIISQFICGKDYDVVVPRTCTPPKLYSDLHISISSPRPTVVSWGMATQPAIQDLARIFESFSKPNPDPSETTGFWDKIRLMMHFQILMDFKGNSNVQFFSKGSRDPYHITGSGAGFVLCWRKNIEVRLGFANEQNELLQIESEEFTIAIPNLAALVSYGGLFPDSALFESQEVQNDVAKNQETNSIKTQVSSDYVLVSDSPYFKFLMKIMDLRGGVRYGIGCHFNRSCLLNPGVCSTCNGQGKCVFKDFIPHYQISTILPEYATAPIGEVHDSFRGFRSDIIHLSVSVTCPLDWNESVDMRQYDKYQGPKNSIRSSPNAIMHGISWASLFDPAMTVPIRQGKLFPSLLPPSLKFPKFLRSVKLKICVEALFLSSFYREDSLYDPLDGTMNIVGLKAKIGKFKQDILLKMQENTITLEGKEVKSRDMIFHEAETDLKDLDVRGIAIRFMEGVFPHFDGDETYRKEELLGKDEDFLKMNLEDKQWVDDDDYVELECKLPDAKPGVRVLPLLRSPQMMYYKKADVQETEEEKKNDHEKHECLMGQGRDTRQIQLDFLAERSNQLSRDIKQQAKLLSEIEDKIINSPNSQELQDMSQSIQKATSTLSKKRNIIQDFMKNLEESISNPESRDFKDVNPDDPDDGDINEIPNFDSSLWADSQSNFGHHIVIHNAKALWNNSLRNLMYRLWDLIEQHQGLTYYMSTSAVTFIRDMQKNIRQKMEREIYEQSLHDDTILNSADNYDFDSHLAAEMLRKLVGEKDANFIVQNETIHKHNENYTETSRNAHDDIPEGYSLLSNYLIQFINLQVNFQCDKNPSSSIIMFLERAQIKIFSIVEDWSKGDIINEVVKTRNFFGLDHVQFFTSSKIDFRTSLSKILSDNNYGSKGNENWPVWIPPEALIDHSKENLLPFKRVIKRTSAKMQYDKFNNLRIKGSDIKKDDSEPKADRRELGDSDVDDFDKRMDSWHIDFPKIKLSATSKQFNLIIDVIKDLLMYREPAKKELVERLNTILLAADLDDLDGMAEKVSSLQEHIRQLDEMRHHYEIQLPDLNKDDIKELRAVEIELIGFKEQLYLLMEAITVSQNRKQKAESKMALKVVVIVGEVKWVMRDSNRKFCEWCLENARFGLMTKEETSANTLEIDHLRVINKLPSPVFKELVGPYIPDHRQIDFSLHKMLRVYWGQLEPVAGIDIVEHFEIDMFPLKFQMQYDVGKLIMMYFFPEKKAEYVNREKLVDPNAPAPHKRPTVLVEQTTKTPKSRLDDENSDEINFDAEIFSEDEMLITSGSTTQTNKQNTKKPSSQKTDQSHELELMKKRASQNKQFIYIKVPGVVHSFSYQGAKEKNLEDLYDFVIQLPTLEYQNRTWSWLDFIEQLKKDAIKIILNHTTALLREKLNPYQKRRPTTPSEMSVHTLDSTTSATTDQPSLVADNISEISNNAEEREEFSDKASFVSNESEEKHKPSDISSKSKVHEKSDSLSRQLALSNFHMRKESNSTVVSKMSSSTSSTTKTRADSPTNENEELEKGKLLLGKFFDDTRSNIL
ncbi:24191_t:CDS:2, partial [Dentiscutata erythropus]